MSFRLWNLSFRENLNLYVFMGVLIVVGAVFGVMLVNALTLEQQQELADHMGVYLAAAKDPAQLNRGTAFWDSFLFYGKWLGLIWLLGLSVIGLPFVLVLDFLKGVLIGFAAALLVQQMAWKGMLLFAASTIPLNVLVVPAIVIGSVSASRFAHFVVKERLFRRKGRLLPPFLAHTAVTGFSLLVLACAALLEAYGSPLLLERIVPLIVSN